jgi:UDP-N-acetylglucosamine 2-epimerase (non-hydrolysing)
MRTIRLLMVFGTRPEAIKLIPLIKKVQEDSNVELIICNTSQHKELLYPVINDYGIKIDYDLNVMDHNQSLSSITIKILDGVSKLLDSIKPDFILVHGDTTTTFTASLAAFYNQTKIIHIEAGLRTFNRFSPYPEEFNRTALSLMAYFHFSPTYNSEANLIKEGISPDKILVTGNTVVDLVKISYEPQFSSPILEWTGNDKFILLTAHRRENLVHLPEMFRAIRDLMLDNPDLKLVYPIHKNPKIIEIANSYFSSIQNVRIVDSLDPKSFHNILARSYFVITDSGGIQEEAPTFSIPVVLMRTSTERPEALDKGIILTGVDYSTIKKVTSQLINDPYYYESAKPLLNPFGDGFASDRILNKIKSLYEDCTI